MVGAECAGWTEPTVPRVASPPGAWRGSERLRLSAGLSSGPGRGRPPEYRRALFLNECKFVFRPECPAPCLKRPGPRWPAKKKRSVARSRGASSNRSG